jgi:hypothetical protein
MKGGEENRREEKRREEGESKRILLAFIRSLWLLCSSFSAF